MIETTLMESNIESILIKNGTIYVSLKEEFIAGFMGEQFLARFKMSMIDKEETEKASKLLGMVQAYLTRIDLSIGRNLQVECQGFPITFCKADWICPKDENQVHFIGYTKIVKELETIYNTKNADYGNSFDEIMQEYGILSAIIRMHDKLNRLKTLINKEPKVVEESIDDTLKDLANYAIMTVAYIRKEREVNEN